MTHPAQARPSSPVGPTSFADPGPRWSRWRRRAAAALLTVCAAAIGATGAPAQQSAAPGPAPEPAQGLDTPVISFNLAGARHLSSGLQYLDLVTMARPWFAAAPGKWSSMNNGELRAGGYLDDQGWPREMPEGMAQLKMFWSGLPSEAASDRSGTYVLSYEGTGEFSFGGAFRPVREEPGRILLEIRESSRGAWLNIVATDPEGTGDYIRNMTLVRQDREDLLALGAMFNPDWLALIADAREIRFMNWNGVNGSVDPQRWEDRPRPDGSGTGRGVPLEHMVQLANEIGVDPWFTMPANATDDYNRGFATAVRDTLDPALTVRVEYSNEIWNNAFRQTRWLQRRSQQDWGERAGLDYGVMRAVRMARIWDEVFAGAPEGRLVKVLGTQAINPWATRTLLAAEVWRKNDPEGWIAPAEVFDELAITTYFGTRAVSDPERRETLVAAIQDPSVDAAAWLTERLRDPDYSSSLPWSAARWQTQADLAREAGMRLMAYEGGQHVHHSFRVRGMSKEVVQLLSAFMAGYVRSQHMADLYAEQIGIWTDLGGGAYMHYTDVGSPSRWGSWGLYAHHEDATPRSAVIEALNAAADPWWDAAGGPHYLQGVTLFGTDEAETLRGTPQEDYLLGRGGDDVFVPGGGGDGIHGGPGDDLAIFAGAVEAHAAQREGEGVRLTGPDGSVLLISVERVAFGDGDPVEIETLLGQGG